MATLHVFSFPGKYDGLLSRLSDYCALTKPEVNLLILMTTSAGYILGSRGALGIGRLIHTILGTLLVASGTATLNQFTERVHDGRMRRTANRPLPAGRLEPVVVLLFGTFLSVAGGVYLLLAVNTLSALLAVATLAGYLLVYTPLKRRTPLCTLFGAIPGAMPILIGWTGASGKLNGQAAVLFGILFLWQFPHFLAIALLYREDYLRAGYKMLPASDSEGLFTRAEIVGFGIALIILTSACLFARGASSLQFVAATTLGAYLLYHCVNLAVSKSRKAASHLLHASVIYLPAILLVLVMHRR